jgi:ATP-dependent helicase/nuclease subunit B
MLSRQLCPPGHDLLAHGAALAFETAPRADLGGLTVLLPSQAVGPGLRAAIAQAGAARGFATVVPPRMATLEGLLDAAMLGLPVVPRARRLADLHRLLVSRGWFGGMPQWDTCRVILALADELSARLPEPPDEKGFLRLIEAHYRGRAARVAEPEARLVYEVWRAYARPARGASLDPGLARRMLLAEAARALAGPLIVVAARTEAVLDTEVAALAEMVSARWPVIVAGRAGLPCALERAWPASLEETPSVRAAALGESDRALFDRVRVLRAPSLEAEAAAAAHQVRTWLAQGKRAIALVAADRMVARRVRALLEREGVLLTDEAGWKLSTTSAATCAMRWIDAVSGNFHQRDLQDWLRSPFVFADVERGPLARARAAIEEAIRRNNLQGGLGALRHALERAGAPDATALAIVDRIEVAARPWARRAAVLDEWFDLLLETLAALGATNALAADAAGILLLDLLRTLRDQLAGGAAQPLAAWRDFLASELEGASFRDSAIDSPLVMTSLARAQLRRFEATLLLGAGEAHLGAADDPGPLFAARLRAQMGLATPEEQSAGLRDSLGTIIEHADEFRATWQSGSAAEPQPLSPWFVRLDVLARAAGHPGLIEAARAPAGASPQGLESRFMGMPAPSAAPLRPAVISVSAYASLIACPYQFFARHMLALNEADEVREEFEKTDYGQWVHDLLNRLHMRFPRFSGMARDVLLTEFHRIADSVFAPAIEFNYLSLGWKRRWVALAEAYIDWQIQREGSGWHWQAGEVKASLPIPAASGRSLELRGRLDRIDARGRGEVEILDYKTQDAAALKRKVAEPGEDVQLAAYRLLHAAGGDARAAFVAVDGKAIRTVPANQQHTPQAERRRLLALVDGIDAGAGLPANAPESACAWCEMRGLCRRDHWAGREAVDG